MLEGVQATAWAVRRLQHRHALMLAEALEPLGITITQWSALRLMRAHPEASLHDLAVLDGSSDQAYGALATRMVAAGLVERIAPERGRSVRHRLTERGEGLLGQAGPVVDDVFNRSLSALAPDERDQLTALLHRVLASAPDPRPALPPDGRHPG